MLLCCLWFGESLFGEAPKRTLRHPVISWAEVRPEGRSVAVSGGTGAQSLTVLVGGPD